LRNAKMGARNASLEGETAKEVLDRLNLKYCGLPVDMSGRHMCLGVN
jgi:hypothetical protein